MSCWFAWAPPPQGKYENAEHLYLCAMKSMERTLGKDHPLQSDIMSNLASLLQKQVRHRVGRCVLGVYLDGIDVLWSRKIWNIAQTVPRHRGSPLLSSRCISEWIVSTSL